MPNISSQVFWKILCHILNKRLYFEFMSDLALVTQLKEGSEIAFRRLVDLHHEKVIQTCYHFVRDQQDADDIAQEVFIEVHRSIEKFREDAKLSTWLYRIAVNKSLNFLRSKKSRERFKRFQDFFTSEKVNEFRDVNSISADEKIEHEERQSILQNAINKLPESQKIAFTLNKYDELSYNEVAEIMKISLPAVESLIFRAKKGLQKQLRTYYEQLMKK